MSECLLLGVDGGGSSTTALLAQVDANGWQMIGCGEAGPSNLVTTAPTTAWGNLSAAIAVAFQAAQREPSQVDFACLAMAGSDRESVRDQIEQWLAEQGLATRWRIVHDAEPLLASARPAEHAIALIAGTGSLAWGRNATGQVARAGGWGPLLGDEGSAYWIALQGLRACLLAQDGRGPDSLLCQLFPSLLAVNDLKQIPQIVRSLDRDQLARFAPIVDDAARAGDAVALGILDQAARELADLVLAVARRLQCPAKLDRLVVTGGVLLHAPLVSTRLCAQLQDDGLGVDTVESVADPVVGAVELAWQAISR